MSRLRRTMSLLSFFQRESDGRTHLDLFFRVLPHTMHVSPAIVLSLHDSKTTDGTHFELSGERTRGIINFLGVAII